MIVFEGPDCCYQHAYKAPSYPANPELKAMAVAARYNDQGAPINQAAVIMM